MSPEILTAMMAVAALGILISRSLGRERRLARVYRRVLDFCEGDERDAQESMYAEFGLPDGTWARPIDLTETDAQYEALDTTLTRAEHGVFS